MEKVDGCPIDKNTSAEKLKSMKKQIKEYMETGRISEDEGNHLIKLINQHPAMQKDGQN